MNPNWPMTLVNSLAIKVGIKPSQVYKWNWDKRMVSSKLLYSINPLILEHSLSPFQIIKNDATPIRIDTDKAQSSPIFKVIRNASHNSDTSMSLYY